MSWLVQGPSKELRGEEKRLFLRVRQTLWDYEPLRASHAEIAIDIHGPNVRLWGRVRTLPQKVLAEVLVKRLPEVEMVSNELVADAEVVRSVCDLLARDERTAPYVLRVEARHGSVVLRGEVPDERVREAALAIAGTSPFAVSIRDEISTGGATFPAEALTAPAVP